MRMTDSLKALEKTMEEEVLTFFTLLGAGEAPEDWQAAGQSLPAPESPHKTQGAAAGAATDVAPHLPRSADAPDHSNH